MIERPLACNRTQRGGRIPSASIACEKPERRCCQTLAGAWAYAVGVVTMKDRTMSAALTRRGVIVLSAVCLSCLMFGLEISSIPAILPTLEQVLHADFKELQWIMNAYTIAVTTVLMAIERWRTAMDASACSPYSSPHSVSPH
jgi:hypothetical protein